MGDGDGLDVKPVRERQLVVWMHLERLQARVFAQQLARARCRDDDRVAGDEPLQALMVEVIHMGVAEQDDVDVPDLLDGEGRRGVAFHAERDRADVDPDSV